MLSAAPADAVSAGGGGAGLDSPQAARTPAVASAPSTRRRDHALTTGAGARLRGPRLEFERRMARRELCGEFPCNGSARMVSTGALRDPLGPRGRRSSTLQRVTTRNVPMPTSRFGSASIGVAVIAIAAAIILALFSIRIVDVGEVGVVHTFGVVDSNERAPGLIFKAPWASLTNMNVRTQQLTFSSRAEDAAGVGPDQTIRTLTREGPDRGAGHHHAVPAASRRCAERVFDHWRRVCGGRRDARHPELHPRYRGAVHRRSAVYDRTDRSGGAGRGGADRGTARPRRRHRGRAAARRQLAQRDHPGHRN